MYRTTRKDLESKVACIARMTGKQFGLEAWSPGDGFTRYRLFVKTTDLTHRDVSYYCRLHEMAAYLDGLMDGLNVLHPEWRDNPYNILNQALPLEQEHPR